MPISTVIPITKSGIKTTPAGESVIPASKRADGSTRKEIRVRPGYTPPEDVATYKNRSADAWKNRGSGGVPGAESLTQTTGDADTKSKNAKRREAARKRAAENGDDDGKELTSAMDNHNLEEKLKEDWRNPSKLVENQPSSVDAEAERQKKIRNLLKKLKGVRDLKEKKTNGEKLSHDQIMKIGKESELVRDLQKLDYDGSEIGGAKDGENLGPKTEENGIDPD